MFLALEPRILLDAAAAVLAGDLIQDALSANIDSDDATQSEQTSGHQDTFVDDHESASDPDDAADHTLETTTEVYSLVPVADGSTATRREIAFVDVSVPDAETLIAGIPEAVEVYRIDGGSSGLTQINEILAGQQNIDAVHILSHGAAGSLTIGTDVVTSATLGIYQTQLSAIGSVLTGEGDILLYGCDIGQDGDFIQHFSELTGADVATSTDPTGSSALGGDWILEANVGNVWTAALANRAYSFVFDSDASQTFNFGSVSGSSGKSSYLYADLAGSGSGTLSINAYDVDYTSGERDAVYFKDANDSSETLLGYLSGSNNANYTTDFNVSFNASGKATIRIYGEAAGWSYSVSSATLSTTGNAAPAFTSGATASVNEDSSVSLTVTGQDGGTLNDNVTLTLSSSPSHGTISGFSTKSGSTTATCSYTYSPTADYNGTDSFVFSLSDGIDTVSQTVTITVNAVADITADSVSTTEDNAVTSSLLSNDSFNASPSINSVTQGSHGSVQIVNAEVGTVSYTPHLNWSGADSYTYTVTSGGKTETATVSVTVAAVNDTPTLTGVSAMNGGTEDTAYTVSYADLAAAANEADLDGDALSFRIESVTSGTLTKGGVAVSAGTTMLSNGDSLVWTPASNANGTLGAFTLKAWDGTVLSASAVQVSVAVASVDDAPTLTLSNSSPAYTENSSIFFVDDELSITDPDTATLSGAKVVIASNFNGSQDSLSWGYTGGNISMSYDSAKGVMTLSGTASLADYQSALRTVKYANSSDSPATAVRGIDVILGDAVAYTPTGGVNHYYQYVSGSYTWTAAKTAAEGLSFMGMTGYLATITSQEENDFIKTKLGADAWIGASDAYSYINAATGATTYENQTAAEGNWYWVTGPEAGKRISTGNVNPVTVSVANGGTGFAYWNSGEPNNAGSEHYGEIYSSGSSGGKWNDLSTQTLGYVVEYSDNGGTASFSKSLAVSINAVNDAPGFGSAQSLAAVNEDTASPAGATLTSLLGGTFSDPDGNSFAGIAISANAANSSEEGAWQYTIDGGTNWYAVGSRTVSAALLLENTANTRLRFVPVSNYNGTPGALTVFAVDSSTTTTWTSGATAVTFDATADDATSKVSAAGVSLGTSITSINDSPTLSAGTPTATLVEKGGAYNGTAGTATSSITLTNGDVDGTASYDTVWLGATGWATADSGATYTKKGTYGTATLTLSSGVVAYALDDSDSDTQALTAASSVTDLFTVQVTDGTATTTGDARFSITGTNDAPALTGLTEKTVAENASASLLDSEVTFADADSANLDGGTLTVSGLDSEDVVSIATTVTHSNGAIQRDGNNMQVSNGNTWTTIGTIDTTSTGVGKNLLITLNNNATPAIVDAVLQSLTFYNNDDSPTASRTLSITVTDGDGGTGAASTVTVKVTPVNDLPVNTVPSVRTTNEDTAIVFSAANTNTISIADLDASSVTTTVSIASGKGTLTATAGGGATLTDNGSVGVQIQGTVAQVNAALAGLTYTPTSNANGNGYATLTVATSDGVDSDTDTVTINVTAVDDKPVASTMAATVGPNSQQLFSQFQPNFSDVDNNVSTEAVKLEILSLPSTGKFQVYDGSGDRSDNANWVDIVDISQLTAASGYTGVDGRLVIGMASLGNYRYDASSVSSGNTNVNWRVMTAGDTNDATGWSNTATGVVTILGYAANTEPSLSITYQAGETTTGTHTKATAVTYAADGTTPLSSVTTTTSNNVVTVGEDGTTGSIVLTYSDTVTPWAFMQGVMTSSNTDLLDFSSTSCYTLTSDAGAGTITLTLKPKADMYGETLITLGAFDGQKTTQETFTLRVNAVNEAPVGTDFLKTIDEDSSYLFSTLEPTSIYSDQHDTAKNAGNAQKAGGNVSSDTANIYPSSFVVVTLPSHGVLKLGETAIASTNYSVAFADLSKLVYDPTANYHGTDSFTWKALDSGGLATANKSATFTVTSVNDAPAVTTPSQISITDSSGASITGSVSATLSASDVENDTLGYRIIGAGSSLVTSLSRTYGTLSINGTTGSYVYTPDLTAISARSSDTSETFTLDVGDGTVHVQKTLTVNISATAETAAAYTEQATAAKILPDTHISTAESYGGGYIEFEVGSAGVMEILSLEKVSTASTASGAVSIVGSAVYLGDGTAAKAIGQIDGVYNGLGGQKLRVNFAVDFSNGGFESATAGLLTSTVGATVSLDGWTVVNDRVTLGSTQSYDYVQKENIPNTIAGLATPLDNTYPAKNISKKSPDVTSLVPDYSTLYGGGMKDFGNLDNVGYRTYIASGPVSNGGTGKSLQMYSSLNSEAGYEVIRGPYVYSSGTVNLQVSDKVSFYWKAEGGGDAYDVFGYIVNVNDASDYQIILNQTGATASAKTAWAKQEVSVDSAGEYRFVFVSGTFDATGGEALGAQLYIDDVKVTQANPVAGIGSQVLEALAQKVTYQNTSDLTASSGTLSRTVRVTTSSGDSTPIVHSSTKALSVTPVNDPVSLATPAAINYTDTDAADVFATATGTLSASDPDSGTTFTYGVTGGSVSGSNVTKAGAYGTLSLNSSTGAYTYTPDSMSMNALASNASDTFTMTVADGSGSNAQAGLTVSIKAVNDAPLLGGTVSNPSFTENGAATVVDPNITISDIEGTSYNGGRIVFSTTANGESTDSFSILNANGISVSGASVSYGSIIIGTLDSTFDGSAGKAISISLNANASSVQVEALARSIGFANSSDAPSASSRTVKIEVDDGGNGGVTAARYSTRTTMVAVVPINDRPALNLGISAFTVEKVIATNPAGTLALGALLSVTDPDNASLTVLLETTSYGTLTVNSSVVGGLSVSGISGNGSRSVTLQGSVDAINTTLAAQDGLTYLAGSGNDYVSPGADYVRMTATDAASAQTVASKMVMVLPAKPNAYSTNIVGQEDGSISVDIDALVTDINKSNVQGSYVIGSGSADITNPSNNITTAGSLTAFASSKLISADYDINGDGAINSTDTNSHIGYQLDHGTLVLNNDATLGGDFAQFTYTPAADWSGRETFYYRYTSGDGTSSNIAAVSIFVTPANDAPVVTVPGTVSLNEDASVTFIDADAITLNDVESGSGLLFDLSLKVSNGTLQLSQTTGLMFSGGGNGTASIHARGSLADLKSAIAGLVYAPNHDFNGSDMLRLSLNDNGNIGQGNSLSASKDIAITVSAVNDAPTATGGTFALVEAGGADNGTSGLGAGRIGLSTGDVDGTPVFDSVWLAAEGWSSIDGGVHYVKAGTYGSATFTLSSGSLGYALADSSATVQAMKEGITYTDSFTLKVTDGALSSTADAVFSIRGVNDAPMLAAIASGLVSEDPQSMTVTESGLSGNLVGLDPDSTLTYGIDGGSEGGDSMVKAGAYGVLTLGRTSGAWGYLRNASAVESLEDGQVVSDVFRVMVSDGLAAAVKRELVIIINGAGEYVPQYAPEKAAQVSPVVRSIQETKGTGDSGSDQVLLPSTDLTQWSAVDISSDFLTDAGLYTRIDAVVSNSPALPAFAVPPVATLPIGQRSFDYTGADRSVSPSGMPHQILYVDKGAPSAPIEVGKVLSFELPKNTFGHSDPAAKLSYEAVQADGSPLPAWIRFDPESRSFFGKPPGNGTLDIVVKARDDAGNEIETLLHLKFGGKENVAEQPEEGNPQSRSGRHDSREIQHTQVHQGRAALSEQFAEAGRWGFFRQHHQLLVQLGEISDEIS